MELFTLATDKPIKSGDVYTVRRPILSERHLSPFSPYRLFFLTATLFPHISLTSPRPSQPCLHLSRQFRTSSHCTVNPAMLHDAYARLCLSALRVAVQRQHMPECGADGIVGCSAPLGGSTNFSIFSSQTFHHNANLKEEPIERLTSRAGGEIKRNSDSI